MAYGIDPSLGDRLARWRKAGYVPQVMTGVSWGNYQDYLEYGVMQELVRGTGRRMWFLHDPIEDNPRHDWTDYRQNYIRTLVASLLHTDVWHYEVSPWPSRVFHGRYPQGSSQAVGIPADYATTLAVVFNQLRDMRQPDVEATDATTGVGVFLSDTAMFQRAQPAFSTGVAAAGDPLRVTAKETRMLTGFYGLALPLLKHGIAVRPVQLDNLVRTPGYLDPFRVLVLSYEFQKPMTPGLHLALAEWVDRGGTLLYVRAATRIQLEKEPQSVEVDGQPCAATEWDAASGTLLLRHPGRPEPVKVVIDGV